jgi:serine/threonine-protein kinase
MGELTSEQIAQRITDLNLAEQRQLEAVWAEFGTQEVEAKDFTQALLRREVLTNYQLERLTNGDRSGYFYGDHKVLYRVAAGSFARVYRAVHKKTGQVVALKVLRKRYSDDPEQASSFYQEGERGRQLKHPNIVPIYEVHSQKNHHFIVMEFVEGQNLRDFARVRGKIDPEEATRIMIDVTEGMHYAHSRGIFHRDLKMSNVLISSRGQARLIDFGLAAAESRADDDEGPNPRTIDYAGLERATGVRKDDSRSDIYFLGCIFYNLLAGKPPLQETKDRIQRLSRSRYFEVEPLARVDASLPTTVTKIVERAMELDPRERFQTPGQMLVELNLALKRLKAGEGAAGDESGDEGGPDSEAQMRQQLAARYIPDSQRKVVMFVESNTRLQDIFRDGLKRCGYRVLLTSDPQRALDRFENEEHVADLAVFSTVELGEAALEAFNQFGQGERTREIPAILLLGEKHRPWAKRGKLAAHRLAATMPLKMRQLRLAVGRLVPLQTES